MELNELNDGQEFTGSSPAVPEIFNTIVKELKIIKELYTGGENDG